MKHHTVTQHTLSRTVVFTLSFLHTDFINVSTFPELLRMRLSLHAIASIEEQMQHRLHALPLRIAAELDCFASAFNSP